MGFVNRHLVEIVVIPSLVGIHIGWSMLQDNKKLVPEGKKIDQPIYTIAIRSWNYLTGQSPKPDPPAK